MSAKVRKLGLIPKFDPESGPDPSFTLTWSGDELTEIYKTVGDSTWKKTFTWTGGNLTAISSWVKQ